MTDGAGLSYRTPRSARAVTVIETVAVRGAGYESDPVREVRQYWSMDGELLAENDPVAATVEGGYDP